MQKSKLIQLLKSLKWQEWRDFKTYIKKNGTNQEHLLVKFLESYYPDFESDELDKTKQFFQFFPNERKYKDFRIRRLLSNTMKQVENFLIHKHFLQNELERKILLMSILSKKEDYKLFEIQKDDAFRCLEDSNAKDIDYLNNKYALLETYYFHPGTNRNKASDHFEQLVEVENKLHALKKIQLECAAINRNLIFPTEAKFQHELNLEGFQKTNITFNLFIQLKQLLTSQNTNVFFSLKDNFLGNLDQLSQRDRTQINSHLLNFGIRESTKTQTSFQTEVLDLYKTGIKYSLILVNGIMTDTTFFNIVVVSAGEKEFEWGEEFIKKQSKYLHPKSKKDIKKFALAYLSFYQNKYEQALELLRGVTHFRFELDMFARTIRIRSCFILGIEKDESYFNILDNHCSSFAQYIHRTKKLPDAKKEPYRNFIIYMKELIQITIDQIELEKKKAELRNKILNTKQVFGHNWLLEQLEVRN